MQTAISNIAWESEHEPQVAELLRDLGLRCVECAPTKYWAAPCHPSADEIQAVRQRWQEFGIEVVAMQSLLFGQPHLNLLSPDERQRNVCVEYLEQILKIGCTLGARRFVFGSPRNRDRGNLSDQQAYAYATAAFSRLGETAARLDCVFCLEPNAPQYNCNFLRTAQEVIDLLAALPSTAGLGINLDRGIMQLNGEDSARCIEQAAPWLRHFHVSEPLLAPLSATSDDHAGIAAALRRAGYAHTVSVEMRSAPDLETSLARVREASQILSEFYSG